MCLDIGRSKAEAACPRARPIGTTENTIYFREMSLISTQTKRLNIEQYHHMSSPLSWIVSIRHTVSQMVVDPVDPPDDLCPRLCADPQRLLDVGESADMRGS